MNEDPTVLLTAQGQELLVRLAAEPDSGGLALAVSLRREYPADLVAAATAQHELRLAARAKFSRAADMLFTRSGYEQSSSEPIARYRAERFGAAHRVADLCCGIGGDLLALAPGREALAVDRDERPRSAGPAQRSGVRPSGERARSSSPMCATSASPASTRYSSTQLAAPDQASPLPDQALPPAGTPLALPSAGPGTAHARAGAASFGAAQRFRAGLSEPPLDWCFALADRVPAVCIKAAPGLPLELLPEAWEAEFIADGRDLKEAVLWSPALATAPPAGSGGPRRATVMSGTGRAPWSPTPVTPSRSPSRGSTCSTRTRPSPGPA